MKWSVAQTRNLKTLNAELSKAMKVGDVALEDVLFDVAYDTHGNAVDGISKPPATGRIYKKYNPKRIHQASAPGQYPMTDLGGLVASVKVETDSPISYRVGTGLMYGKYLEFGTSKMRPRPWLLRSFSKASADVAKELSRRFKSGV